MQPPVGSGLHSGISRVLNTVKVEYSGKSRGVELTPTGGAVVLVLLVLDVDRWEVVVEGAALGGGGPFAFVAIEVAPSLM